jgi:integrase/recombinase XerD
MTPNTASGLALVGDDRLDRDELVAAGFLMRYREPTRTNYTLILKQWFTWCTERGISPLAAERAHIEVYARELEERHSLKLSTIAGKLNAIGGFYKFAYIDKYLDHNPAEHVRRPTVPRRSTTEALTRVELLKLLDLAENSGHVSELLLVGLLGLNGLRIGEALALNLEDVTLQGSYMALKVTREKGNRPGLIPLPHRLMWPIQGLQKRQQIGAILRMRNGERMDRRAAGRIIARLCKEAGIAKRITPHSLRHTFVTLALDAGANARDVQNSLGYSDLRMVSYYDRHTEDLSRNATHLVAAYVEGS